MSAQYAKDLGKIETAVLDNQTNSGRKSGIHIDEK